MSLGTSKPRLLQQTRTLEQFDDAVDPPEGIRPWLRCHYCRIFATKDKPVKRCARCDKNRVQEGVFYCSKECQKKDWIITHREICGVSMQQYNSWLDSGFFLGGSHMNGERQRLKQWNYIYRRPILWAARQAFAANPLNSEGYYLLIECETVLSSTGENCIVPCSFHFKWIPDNPTAVKCVKAGSTILHCRGEFATVACCTKLSGVENFSLVPLCGQDQFLSELSAGIEAYSTPCPQWPWLLRELAAKGEQSTSTVDRFFSGMLSTMQNAKSRLGGLLEPFSVPKLMKHPWKIPNQQDFSELMGPSMIAWSGWIEPVRDFIHTPRGTATGLLLEAFTRQYYRTLIWAVRQAFSSNSGYKHTEYCLSIDFRVMQKPIPSLQERPVPVRYWFDPLPKSGSYQKTGPGSTGNEDGMGGTLSPIASNAICQLHFYGEGATMWIPLDACDQDLYFTPFSKITSVPSPQWPSVFYELACHGLQDATALDTQLPQLLTCVAEATNQAGPRLQKMKAPRFGCNPWSIDDHGLFEWLNLVQPWTKAWVDTFQEPDTFSYPPFIPEYADVKRF